MVDCDGGAFEDISLHDHSVNNRNLQVIITQTDYVLRVWPRYERLCHLLLATDEMQEDIALAGIG